MPTQTKENYLKAIYFLELKNPAVSITDLSKEMGVSTPTASNMVKKLQEKGWVSYQRYKPLKMSDQGRKVAALIIRKHRLAEMFLTKIMGFGWEEVHDIAEDIEHIQSEKFFDRMDEILGYPTVDPHGSPIPDKEGNVTRKKYKALSEFNEQQTIRVCALSDTSNVLLEYLNSKQIRLGTEIKILRIEPFDKSMIISYDQNLNVTLSEQASEHLLVEEIK